MKFDELRNLLCEEDPKNPADIKQDVTIGKLINYIKSHGFRAWEENGSIKAIEEYTKDGEPGEKEVVIKPNIKAVRNWLGY